MGQQEGEKEIEKKWLVFSKEIHNEEKLVGYAEVAFALIADAKKPEISKVEPLADSTLAVFFPTVLPTNTGFLIQGPYRTTPSRDDVDGSKGGEWTAVIGSILSALCVAIYPVALTWTSDVFSIVRLARQSDCLRERQVGSGDTPDK